MPRPRSKELARAADHATIRRATKFHVTWFLGRGQYRHADASSVTEARLLRDAAGADPWGRIGLVYAVCPNGAAVHVDESYQEEPPR